LFIHYGKLSLHRWVVFDDVACPADSGALAILQFKLFDLPLYAVVLQVDGEIWLDVYELLEGPLLLLNVRHAQELFS